MFLFLNVISALVGTLKDLFLLHCSWCWAVWGPLKVSLYIIHSADYILYRRFESVVLDHRFLILWVPFDIIQSLNRLPYQI